MQVQTIDKEDKVDKDQNELIVIDQVHDEVIQLPDKELEFLFIRQLKRFVDSYLSSVKRDDGRGHFCNNSKTERPRELRFSLLRR
jgi:hypothetical protein